MGDARLVPPVDDPLVSLGVEAALHLLADLGYQQKMVRFIENHDEPRAATAFAPGKARAAAVAILTLVLKSALEWRYGYHGRGTGH